MKRKITILSRSGCHLYETGLDIIKQISNQIPIELEIIDIESNYSLYNQFKNDIPVILLDGKEIARHRIDSKEISKKLKNP